MIRIGLRRTARLLFALAALSTAAGAAAQGAYPNRPITIVVGFSAGGTTDIIARLLSDELRKGLGQPIIIENKPGAGGNIGADAVAKAKPDGYTLLMGSVGPLAINASLYKHMPYDNLKDLAPVTLVAHVPNMLVVNPRTVPAQTFQEFVALAKAQPGKFFYASTGSGTSSHLSGVLLNQLAGLDLTHVPYKGAVALNDVLSGEQVQCMFATIPSAIQLVRSGKLRALAVTSLHRSGGVPNVPTIAESGYPGFDASSWFGLVGPAGLPREIALKVQAEVARILKDPAMRDKFIQQGADPIGNTPEEFGQYMKDETAKWAKVVKASGAKAD
jgi:tripartite-type tricarboxylate transporter receptor subunit TctC